MGGIIYSGAPRGRSLDGSRRAERRSGILEFANRGIGGCGPSAAGICCARQRSRLGRKGWQTFRRRQIPCAHLWSAIVDAGFAMLVPGLRSGEERGGAKLETRKQKRENRQKHRSEDRPLQWRARALIGSQWLFLKTQLGHSPYIRSEE